MSKDKNAAAAAQAREEHVAALKAEREGYERRGLADRVKQVDAQIKHFAGEPVGRTQADTDTAAPAKRGRGKGTSSEQD